MISKKNSATENEHYKSENSHSQREGLDSTEYKFKIVERKQNITWEHTKIININMKSKALLIFLNDKINLIQMKLENSAIEDLQNVSKINFSHLKDTIYATVSLVTIKHKQNCITLSK